ncbi:hypothetical protein PVAND_016078 [Polypedilum vanderplanki]|uniref:Uncharacterized protein n=1 Tax=Polypedilum vanderplanki TaxID=319348 RepID=A0A9J6BEE3_POLVA|nr:hypothetical protein PVAND_016078 [Polypedilum vanderplanki]
MRFEIENFFDLSTIHGLKYLSKKFHWIERFFWSLSLFISIILTIYLITELFINLNHDPVITHIADHQVPITDIDFPAITVCLGQEHVIPYYYEKFKYYKRLSHIKYSDKKIFKDFADEIKYFKYMNYAAILDEIAKGYFDVDKLGLKILKRLQVIDILTKRGILSQLNISIPTDDFLDVLSEFQRANIREILPLFHWSRDFHARYSIILTEFGLCRSFNLALPEDIFYIDSISDDFLHNYFTDSDYNGQKNNTEIIPRKAENSDDSVNFWTGGKPRETEVFKFEGYMIFYHDPYEMPKKNTKAVIINVQETHIMNLFFTPEMVDIDQSLYDVDPFDRNCYFDDERKLNLFKVYTKANCESECLTNFMIRKCDCAEFFMIRNCTTRICSAIDKNCIDKANRNFERQKSQCKCLPQCTYVKFDVKRVDGSGGIKEQYNINNEQKSANIFIKFLKSSFPRFVRKQNFDFVQFLSFVGGLLGLFAGFSMISAVEIFYWFFVRIFTKKFFQRSTKVHPFNEKIEKKSNIFKEYFGNSSIHGLNYGINTNLIEK